MMPTQQFIQEPPRFGMMVSTKTVLETMTTIKMAMAIPTQIMGGTIAMIPMPTFKMATQTSGMMALTPTVTDSLTMMLIKTVKMPSPTVVLTAMTRMVRPGTTAIEVYYDGVDQNCDGLSDYDADEDGEESIDYGGTDCDDLDASVYSGAMDTPDDGIDQDCDGQDSTTLTVDYLQAGDLLISEIMSNPQSGSVDWFEVYNNTTFSVDITGLTISNSTNSTTVSQSIIPTPGEYMILSEVVPRFFNQLTGSHYDIAFSITASSDVLTLEANGLEIDHVDFLSGDFAGDAGY